MLRLRLSKYVAKAMHRERKQLKRDTFFCGGKGGQKQNKTETGVRITDLVTGISREGREHRTQHQNQAAAMERLILALKAHYEEEERKDKLARFRARRHEVRVYKAKHGIVKDQATGKTYDYGKTLDGDLSPLIRDRLIHEAQETEI